MIIQQTILQAPLAGRTFAEEAPPIPAKDQAESREYELAKLKVGLVSLAVGMAYLLVMGLWGGVKLSDALAPVVSGNRWLELIAFTIVILIGAEITLPIDFYKSYTLEHRYGLSNQTVSAWAVKHLKMFALSLVLSLLLVCGLYAILWTVPQWWWLIASLGMLMLTVVLGQLFPVLIMPMFYKMTPLENADLIDRFTKLTESTAFKIEATYRMNLSKETKKANAMLTGLGKTKRVIIADTLLDHFEPDEIEVVFAHELGHSVCNHLVKGICINSLLTVGVLYLSDLFIRTAAPAVGHASFTAVSALPLYLFVFSFLGTVLGPLEKGITRQFERESDWYALERTANAGAFTSAFNRLARLNKADLAPPKLVVLLFHDHPPIGERLAMAQRWQAQR
jgi:STE24 endopeptidase